MPTLVLASASPRRELILRNAGLRDFRVVPSDVDESTAPDMTPEQVVTELSRRKAESVAAELPQGTVVLAADTVVALGGEIYGKPSDDADAERMISSLSGRTHTVHTGVTIMLAPGADCAARSVTFCESTRVTFRSLTRGEILAYVASGECRGKAGAYGIQERGSLLVEKLEGDYFNVMGLPICRTAVELRKFGIDLLKL